MSAALSKTPADENFPVASFLLRPQMRAPTLAFYRFVRRADDVADDPVLAPQEKLSRLAAFEGALLAGDSGDPVAKALADVDGRFGVGRAEALAMLEAFRQDASPRRYETLDDLRAYCAKSAAPAGRFLLRLHGETESAFPASDALCAALQILNHIQDAADDRRSLDRVYLPQSWLAEAGGEAAFFDAERGAARRPVLDALLDRVDEMICDAAALPEAIRDRRLALQACATIEMAWRLRFKLSREDPVLGRVAVGRRDFIAALPATFARARRAGADARAVRRVVSRSRSSFRLGMSVLEADRRRAINAVYAFCRRVDDVADCSAPREEKSRLLAGWRSELDRPTGAVGRELAWARERFDLPPEELLAVLDGMEQDARGRVRIADTDALDLYCRRVAGAVGVLAVSIFGATSARDFALTLGRTLQIVNVMRDVGEDARADRVYVPLSWIEADPALPALQLIRSPRFEAAWIRLAAEAEQGFAASGEMLRHLDRRRLKPAILMMEGYRCLFRRMAREGGPKLDAPRSGLRFGERLRLLSRAATPA